MPTRFEDSKSVLVFIYTLIPKFFTALSKYLLNVSARVELSEITSPLLKRLILEI